MVTDLLRRAAARLRESANAAANVAPGNWFEAPSNPRPNRVVVADGQATPVATVHENCELPHLAGYLTLVHPPLGLELADWLDETADHLAAGGLVPILIPAVAVARKVLREPEGGDRT